MVWRPLVGFPRRAVRERTLSTSVGRGAAAPTEGAHVAGIVRRLSTLLRRSGGATGTTGAGHSQHSNQGGGGLLGSVRRLLR